MNAKRNHNGWWFYTGSVLSLCFVGSSAASSLEDASAPIEKPGFSFKSFERSFAQIVAPVWPNDPLFVQTPAADFDAVKKLPGDSQSVTNCTFNPQDKSVLTLMTAIDLALCNNPKIASAWANIKLQTAALGQAQSAYFPTANAGIGRTIDVVRYPADQSETHQRGRNFFAGANWRLFDFGTRRASVDSAHALLDAALANQDAELQKSLAMVIGAYFDAQTAWADWNAKQQNTGLAQGILNTAQRREQNGAGAQTDTLQAATALERARLAQSRAHGTYQKALATLVYSLGITAGTPLTLDEELSESGAEIQRELNDWLQQVQNQHPALVAARKQLVSAQQDLIATRAEGLPTLDFSTNYYRNGRQNQSLSAVRTRETVMNLTLNVPIFEGFARTYKIKGAEAKIEQKKADLKDTENQILLELVKSHADAMSSFENLQASRLLLNSAEAASASVQRKFERGAADISEVLNTLASVIDARQERLRCLAEWRSARLRLFASAGTLDRQTLQQP